jgi:hypothetical protein
MPLLPAPITRCGANAPSQAAECAAQRDGHGSGTASPGIAVGFGGSGAFGSQYRLPDSRRPTILAGDPLSIEPGRDEQAKRIQRRADAFTTAGACMPRHAMVSAPSAQIENAANALKELGSL